MPLRGPATFIAVTLLLPIPAIHASGRPASRLAVRLVTDEPEAVLAILAKREASQPVTDADWRRLFASEGYLRLKRREAAMHRDFTDDDFRQFVLSDDLAGKGPALEETLARWRKADLSAAAARAFAYLPSAATIRAKVYPSIKPRQNSFVFEVSTDPAIFLYLDPAITQEEFENTVAHEFHHIGFGTGCSAEEDTGPLDPAIARMRKWMTAFGEGFATLAATNSPDGHPRPSNRPEQRADWDEEMARFAANHRTLDAFFLRVAEGKLNDEETDKQAYGFFGTLGPWYTVGWKMAVIIEQTAGREKLIACFCDIRQVFATYNRAAAELNRKRGESLPLWSEKVVDTAAGRARRISKEPK